MYQMSQSKRRLLGCKTKSPLSFSVCGQLVSPSGFIHHCRCFDKNVLIMIAERTLYITVNNTEHTFSAGQYILLLAGEERLGFRPTEGWLSYLWTHFRSDRCFEPASADNADGYTYLLPEISYVFSSGMTAQLFHQLMDMYLEENLYARSMPDYAVSLLLMELSQEYSVIVTADKNSPPSLSL